MISPLPLYRAVTFAVFQIFGICPWVSVLLNRSFKGYIDDEDKYLMIMGEIESGPAGLFLFRTSNWSCMSCSVIWISESSNGHKGGNSGRLVSSVMSDAIEVKKLLSASALSSGCIRILLFTLRGLEHVLVLLIFPIDLAIRHHFPGGTVLSTRLFWSFLR